MQSSSKCTISLAGGALGGGVLHTYRPSPPSRAPRPVLWNSSFTVKTPVRRLHYLFLFINLYFFNELWCYVRLWHNDEFHFNSFTLCFTPHEVGPQIDYKSAWAFKTSVWDESIFSLSTNFKFIKAPYIVLIVWTGWSERNLITLPHYRSEWIEAGQWPGWLPVH